MCDFSLHGWDCNETAQEQPWNRVHPRFTLQWWVQNGNRGLVNIPSLASFSACLVPPMRRWEVEELVPRLHSGMHPLLSLYASTVFSKHDDPVWYHPFVVMHLDLFEPQPFYAFGPP